MLSYRNCCSAVALVLILIVVLCMGAIAQGPTDLTVQDQSSPSASSSASQTARSADDDSWHFILAPYLWFPGIHGTVGALGHNASVHVSGSDVLSNFNFGIMGAVEARKKRFVMPIDFMWVRLGDEAGIPLNDFGQTSIKAHMTQSIFTPKFGYRIVDNDRWQVDALAGIRYWHLGEDLTLRPSGFGQSQSANWVDGVGGMKIQLALSPKVSITALGDAGAGQANLDYQAAGLLGVKVKPNIALLLGWRYLYVDYTGNKQFIYNVAQSGPVLGMTFELGGKPPVPPSSDCSVSPTEVWAGEPVVATIGTHNFNPKHTLTYSWTSSGAKVEGTGTTGNVNTSGLAPGNYSVSGTATDSKEKKNNVATCTASFTVKTPHPPTATCSASPDTVKAGDPATVTVNASSPDNFPLTYAWTTNAGSINGNGTTASLDTTNAAQGSAVTTTATVTDSRGLTATCNANVNILSAPVVVNEVTEVGECKFMDEKRPARVDNTCKAVLDDVALKIQHEPNGKFVVVGYEEEEETVKVPQHGAHRAVNVKYYLVNGEGGSQIDATRLEVRTSGTVKQKGTKIYFVPSGATFSEESAVIDETQVQGQSRNAPASKKAKKAKKPESTTPPSQ